MKKLIYVVMLSLVLPATGFAYELQCPQPAQIKVTQTPAQCSATPDATNHWYYTNPHGFVFQYQCATLGPVAFAQSASLMKNPSPYDTLQLTCNYLGAGGVTYGFAANIPTTCKFNSASGAIGPLPQTCTGTQQACALECS